MIVLFISKNGIGRGTAVVTFLYSEGNACIAPTASMHIFNVILESAGAAVSPVTQNHMRL